MCLSVDLVLIALALESGLVTRVYELVGMLPGTLLILEHARCPDIEMLSCYPPRVVEVLFSLASRDQQVSRGERFHVFASRR